MQFHAFQCFNTNRLLIKPTHIKSLKMSISFTDDSFREYINPSNHIVFNIMKYSSIETPIPYCTSTVILTSLAVRSFEDTIFEGIQHVDQFKAKLKQSNQVR